MLRAVSQPSYSPGGMLTSSELDLIECLATNSLLIDRLLPGPGCESQ